MPAAAPAENIPNDEKAREALKRLRLGGVAPDSRITLSATHRTSMAAGMAGPPQLKADVSEDRADITIDWAQPVVVQVETQEGEVLLRLDQPVDPNLVKGLAEQMPEWLTSVIAGYDSLLFVGKPDVDLNFAHDAETSRLTLTRAIAQASAEGGDPTDLRLEILRARLKARTGETDEAREKLARLQTSNPENPDVLVELANIEESVGSWRRASGLYERALGLDPERRDAAAAQRALDREFGEFVRVDTDYQKVHGGDDQVITVVSGRFLPTDALDVGFSLENRYLDDDQVLPANGVNESVSIQRQRGEIYVGGSPASGHRIEGAALGSASGPGASARYNYQTPDTSTTLTATWNRAYWELVEGIADDASQDRLSLRHEHQISRNWSGDAGLGFNRYGIDGIDTAATSVDISGSIRYRVPWEAIGMSVGYSLNAQYVGTLATRRDVNGNAFNPLPLSDTEIHSLDVSLDGGFWDDWRYNVFGSLSYDRFGGFGPSVGCEVVHEVREDMAYGLRCGHSRVSGRGDNAAFSRLGGFFLVRF